MTAQDCDRVGGVHFTPEEIRAMTPAVRPAEIEREIPPRPASPLRRLVDALLGRK
jgi:hypothetical protein